MFDKIIEVGECCGMEVNVENSKDDVQNTDYDATQQPENVEYLNYLCSVITNDVRCRREIKSIIVTPKGAIDKRQILFTIKLDLNLRK